MSVLLDNTQKISSNDSKEIILDNCGEVVQFFPYIHVSKTETPRCQLFTIPKCIYVDERKLNFCISSIP